jgi:hypothetical protein
MSEMRHKNKVMFTKEKYKDVFIDFYNNKLKSESNKAEIDEVIKTEIPLWDSDAPIKKNICWFDLESHGVVSRVLMKVRITRIVQLSKVYDLLFAPACEVEYTWPFVLMKTNREKYTITNTDPFTGELIRWPAKFKDCNHIECFDYGSADSFRFCPFCKKKAGGVVLDKTLKVIIDMAPQIPIFITLWKDFYWTAENISKEAQTSLAFYKGIDTSEVHLPPFPIP